MVRYLLLGVWDDGCEMCVLCGFSHIFGVGWWMWGVLGGCWCLLLMGFVGGLLVGFSYFR